MDIITGDLLNITSGVIAHQVNCQNKMGAGVAKALYQRYPAVKSSYHAFCQQMLANGGKPADLPYKMVMKYHFPNVQLNGDHPYLPAPYFEPV